MISAPRSGAAHRVDGVRDRPQRVDVEPRVGLVQHRDVRLQDRHLEDLAALLLAAGEALVQVAARELAVHAQQLHVLLERLAELLQVDRVLAARLAVGVDRRAQEVDDRDARDRGRVLERHEQAGAGALVRVRLGQVLALEEDLAVGDLVARVAHDGVARVDLPEPFGPHQGVDLAAGDRQVDAAQDLLALDGHMQVLDL